MKRKLFLVLACLTIITLFSKNGGDNGSSPEPIDFIKEDTIITTYLA